MLFNLMAALSLASLGAVAGIASDLQSVDGVALDKSYLIERKNAVAYPGSSDWPSYMNYHASLSADVLFDGDLYFYEYAPVPYPGVTSPVVCPSGASAQYDPDMPLVSISVSFDSSGFDHSTNYITQYTYYYNGNLCNYHPSNSNFRYQNDDEIVRLSLACFGPGVVVDHENDWFAEFVPNSYARLTILKSTYSYDSYMADHSIVGGIASGLSSVQHYATSLVSGFDALALDNGALTNSMAFAFTLLGIGTAVGICKLTFNWITGRHGM